MCARWCAACIGLGYLRLSQDEKRSSAWRAELLANGEKAAVATALMDVSRQASGTIARTSFPNDRRSLRSRLLGASAARVIALETKLPAADRGPTATATAMTPHSSRSIQTATQRLSFKGVPLHCVSRRAGQPVSVRLCYAWASDLGSATCFRLRQHQGSRSSSLPGRVQPVSGRERKRHKGSGLPLSFVVGRHGAQIKRAGRLRQDLNPRRVLASLLWPGDDHRS